MGKIVYRGTCGHIVRESRCRCMSDHVSTRFVEERCEDCERGHQEAIQEVAAFDFNKLHGMALEHIAMLRRSGMPEDGLRYLISDWFNGLVKYLDMDENLAHEVFLVLDDDKAFC